MRDDIGAPRSMGKLQGAQRPLAGTAGKNDALARRFRECLGIEGLERIEYRAGNATRRIFLRLADIDEKNRAVGEAALQVFRADIFNRRSAHARRPSVNHPLSNKRGAGKIQGRVALTLWRGAQSSRLTQRSRKGQDSESPQP